MTEKSQAVMTAQDMGLAVARDPNQVLQEAHRAAKALKDVLDKRPKDQQVWMNGKRYLEFIDWLLVGKFYGVTAKVVETKYVDYDGVRGWEAKAVAFHGPTGQEISAAEALCLSDEDKWSVRAKYEWQEKDGKKVKVKVGEVPVPLFQLKSMAQTRACGKVLKNVFAWVVVLAGYQPQVAEEMTGDEEADQPAKPPIQQPTPKNAPQQPQEPAKPEAEPKAASGNIATFVPLDVNSKDGTGARGPWTKYGIKGPDGWYSTFDGNLGHLAESAKESGNEVRIKWKPSGDKNQFKDIVTLELVVSGDAQE